MIPIQRLSIEELEALELAVSCYVDSYDGIKGATEKYALMLAALTKLRAVVPLPERQGCVGDVMKIVEKVDGVSQLEQIAATPIKSCLPDFDGTVDEITRAAFGQFPPCAKDAPELPR